MKNSRDFKGIWIPAEIWLNTELNATEKIIIAEVHSLSNQERGCFANNGHFSLITGLSNSRCSAIINKLKDKGMLKIEYIYKEDNPKEIQKRIMRIDFTYSKSEVPLSNTKGAPFENKDTPLSDLEEPPFEYSEDKVPSLNTQLESTKKKETKEKDFPDSMKPLRSQQFFQDNGFGTLTPSSVIYQDMVHWIDDFKKLGATFEQGDDMVILSLTNSVENGVRTWKYTNGTLRNWIQKGLYTPEMVEASEKEREANHNTKGSSKNYVREESLPEWATEKNKGEEIDLVKQEEFRLRLEKIRNRKKIN
ncbi:DnaD domain protein [Marinilactibacillus sp. XAAS-LB27]|uniref:DnaD domain protein n=1 Tax=Marinilactibacillus sp. XAAS-LB27 TaxID=3114538 RepID=UPI002E19196C|nr:DnaD domain protein [Marinilactibacillus sp. XAAS-LB27]